MDSIETRVARGAALLDEERVDWRSEIDLDALCMQDMYYCILGQLFGSYSEGKSALGLDDIEDYSDHKGRSHGFDLSEDEYLSENVMSHWQALEDAWRAQIQ